MTDLRKVTFVSFFLITSLFSSSLNHKIRFERSDLALVKEGEYHVIHFKEGISAGDIRSPEIPAAGISLILPSDAAVQGIRIIDVQTEPLEGRFVVHPVQRPTIPGEVPVFAEPDGRLYSLDRSYPFRPVRLTTSGRMSGYTIVNVLVYPVQYIPSDSLLLFNSEISFVIDYLRRPEHPSVPERRYPRSQRLIDRMVQNIVLNPEELPVYRPHVQLHSEDAVFAPMGSPSAEGSGVDYLIITNQVMKPAFDQLARCKTRKGVPAVVRTLTEIRANTPNGADDAETLRFFIRQAYEKWGVMWVLLGGDVTVVPARYVEVEDRGKRAISDLYYAHLDGNWNADGDGVWGERLTDQVDTYPDVFVGRAPVETLEEAESFVAKVVAYEQGTGNHQNKILYLGENLGSSSGDGEYYCELMDSHVKQSWMDKTKLYENRGNQNRQATLSAMNEGQGFIFNVSHGNAYRILAGPPGHAIEYGDVYSLSNRDNYSILYSVTCNAGDISYNDSFSEYFMLNPSGGGIGYIGSTWLDYPAISRVQNEEFFRLLFEENHHKLGEVFARARLPLVPYISISRYRQVTLSYLLLGDPELDVFTNIPSNLSVLSTEEIPVGQSDIAVWVTNPDSLDEPVSQALVCLQKDGEVYAVGETDSTGLAVFTVSSHTPGVIHVTVTKHDHRSHTGQIEVKAGEGPHAYVRAHAFEDEDSGNGDATPNAGERLRLKAHISNSGQKALTGSQQSPIQVFLNSVSSLVQLPSDTFEIPRSIEPSREDSALFEITIDPNSPDGNRVPFTISIRNEDGAWEDTLNMKVRSPEIRHLFTQTQDSLSQYTCLLTLRNEGTGSARSISGRLSAVEGNASFSGDSHNYGDLLPGDAKEGVFVFEAGNGLSELVLQLTVNDHYGRIWIHHFDLVAPGMPGGLVHEAGKERISLSWQPSHEEDLFGYYVYRSQNQAGPFRELNAHAIRGVAFYEDTGLEPSQRYYYRVTAVDSSGNESPLSEVHAAWTENEALEGWPLEVGRLEWSGPAAGDVDGDGDREIFIGGLDGRLYGFDHTGGELIDPDGNPATLNGFASTGYSIWSSPAIGDLDRDGILEVVVSPRGPSTGNTVYAWKTRDDDNDGSPDTVSGWPTPFLTRKAMISSPVLTDVDGDRYPEVIVMDQSGAVHVWEHDGTLKEGWPRMVASGKGSGQLYATVAVGNLDDDPQFEIVACGGNRSMQKGSIYVFGHALLDDPLIFNGPGPFSASPVLGDLDGDGELEIVAVSENHRVYVLNSDGSEMSGWEDGKMISVVNIRNLNRVTPSPAVGDLDRDGELEVVVPGMRSIMVWHADGSPMPGFPVENIETPASPVIADVDGLYDTEIIVGGGDKKMYAIRSDGSAAPGFPISLGAPVYASAVVDDIDGDGLNEVAWSCGDFKVYMIRTMGSSSLIDWGGFHNDMANRGLYPASIRSVGSDGDEPQLAAVPESFVLYPNFPNPFNPTTTIRFSIPKTSHVTVTVYDLLGREVETLLHEDLDPGRHEIQWDAGETPSGIYFVRMVSGDMTRTRKLTVLR